MLTLQLRSLLSVGFAARSLQWVSLLPQSFSLTYIYIYIYIFGTCVPFPSGTREARANHLLTCLCQGARGSARTRHHRPRLPLPLPTAPTPTPCATLSKAHHYKKNSLRLFPPLTSTLSLIIPSSKTQRAQTRDRKRRCPSPRAAPLRRGAVSAAPPLPLSHPPGRTPLATHLLNSCEQLFPPPRLLQYTATPPSIAQQHTATTVPTAHSPFLFSHVSRSRTLATPL